MLVVVSFRDPKPGIKPDMMRRAAMGAGIELARIIHVVDQVAVEIDEERFHDVLPR